MTIAAIALFAALSGSPAIQEETAPRVETRSEIRIVTSDDHDGPGHLDADGDGIITREEFAAPMGNAFDRLDADHDGRLTTEELAAGHGEGGPGEHMMMRHPGGPEGPGGHGDRVIVMRDGPGGAGGPGGPGAHFRTFGGEGGPGVIMLDGERGGPGGDARVFTFRHGGPDGDHEDGPGERHVEIRRFGGPGGDHSMDANNDGKVSEEEFLAPMREAFQHMDANHNGTLDEGEGHDGPPPAH